MSVGTVAIPKSCVAVSRNLDYDFIDGTDAGEPAYRISKEVSA
jgi:uridine phosphorylase